MSDLVERLGNVAQKLQGQPNTDCLTVLGAADRIANYERRIRELEAALETAIRAKESAERQASAEHLRVYGEELAKLPAKITELKAKVEIDKITMDNFLGRLRKHDTLITELREMAEKWRDQAGDYATKRADNECADELTALLEKQEQSDED